MFFTSRIPKAPVARNSLRASKSLRLFEVRNASTRAAPRAAPLWSIGGAFALGVAGGFVTFAVPQILNRSNLNRKLDIPQYGSRREMEKAITKVQELLGEDSISRDAEDLKLHGYSEWSSVNIQQLPIAVTYPKNTAEVVQIVKICNEFKIPMVPFSAGSSVEGNFSAPFGGFSVDLMHMDQIVTFHQEDMDIVVQPSMAWMDLNQQIKSSGLFFPIDPGPSAKIGGMVGTNCSGTNAVRYGTMKDWVLNLTVVLADGSIIKTRRRPRKSSAGYNLNGLFVGSEGTLGIVTEVTLKLAPIPDETSVAVVSFPSMRDAANAAVSIIQKGIPVAALEILDDVQMKVINQNDGTSRHWNEQTTLFFKFSGTKNGVREQISLVNDIAFKNRGGKFEFAKDEAEKHDLWSARKQALWSLLALREEGGEVWSTDVAVPLSRLADILEISKQDMDSLGLFGSLIGHVGDGNFHESILYDNRDPKQREAVEKCVHDMVDRAIEMDGTCTGEHSIGLGKKGFLLKELDANTIGVMRNIKRSLDPHWLMNPGKIFDP